MNLFLVTLSGFFSCIYTLVFLAFVKKRSSTPAPSDAKIKKDHFAGWSLGYAISWISGCAIILTMPIFPTAIDWVPIKIILIYMIMLYFATNSGKCFHVAFMTAYVLRWMLAFWFMMYAEWRSPNPLPLTGFTKAAYLVVGSEVLYLHELGVSVRVSRQRYYRKIDLFDGQNPLREHKGAGYSIGPDGIDGKGMIEYDPTNGIISRGDIVLYRKIIYISHKHFMFSRICHR